MTSEDYMMDRYWDSEVDHIIEDFRIRLYDLKEVYDSNEVPMSQYKDVEDYRDFRDVKNPNE